MDTRTHRLAVLLAGLVAAAPGLAQPSSAETDEAVEPTPRYRVEFILFAHRDVGSVGEALETVSRTARGDSTVRRWPFGVEPERGEFGELVFGDRPPPGAGQPRPNGAPPRAEPGVDGPRATPGASASPPAGGSVVTDRPSAAAGAGADATAPGLELLGPPGFRGRVPTERWFEPLPADELMLGDTRRRLERLGAYRVLAHAGWEQDALPEQQARALDLADLGIANPSGTLTLFLSRYLHLIVDLGFQTDVLEQSPGAARAAGLTEIRTAPTYVLDTRRRVPRTGELHYIDHPLFGMLFIVTDAPEEPEQTETPEDTEGAGLEPAA